MDTEKERTEDYWPFGGESLGSQGSPAQQPPLSHVLTHLLNSIGRCDISTMSLQCLYIVLGSRKKIKRFLKEADIGCL